MRRIVGGIVILSLLLGMVGSIHVLEPAKAEWQGNVTIRSDGSVDPPEAPILRNGEVYTLTDDIRTYGYLSDGIWIERDNIVLVGAGHIVDGGPDGNIGIVLYQRYNVTVKQITVKSFYSGIFFRATSNSTISQSVIKENRYYGVYFYFSTSSYNNTIIENRIIDNDIGIKFFETTLPYYTGNKVFHNDFIGNAWRQASEVIGCDDWDDGYPSGGNFWSDYTGQDLKSGPNQDQPGSDGIGDTPYVIGSWGEDRIFQDRYPLIKTISDDIYVTNVKPIQVVEDASALVRYKDTAIQVDVMNTFATNKWVKIETTYDFGHSSYTESGRARKGIMLKPGLNRVYLPGGPVYDWQGGSWVKSEGPWTPLGPNGQLLGDDFFFKWNTQTGVDDNLKVRVQPLLGEVSKNNNEKTIGQKVVEIDRLDIIYLPLSMIGESENQRIEDDRRNGDLYLGGTYPIDQVNSALGYSKKLLYVEQYSGYLDLMLALGAIETSRRLSGIDSVVCIVPTYPDSWFHHYFPWKFPDETPGATPKLPFIGQLSTVIVEDTYWSAIPHEIGHTFGLRLDREEYGASTIGRDASGFYVKIRSRLDNSLCIMGASGSGIPLDGKQLDMTYEGKSYTFQSGYWICNECYDNLLNAMKKGQDPEVLYMSGIVFSNDTAVLNDWYHIQNGVSDLPLGQTGNYNIVFLDEQDTVIGQTGCNMSLDEGFDDVNFTAFVFGVEYPSQTRRIRIIHNDTIIVDRAVSANPPSVTITSPNGGESLANEMVYNVSWAASDADGDYLHYTLEYSVDGGTNWLLLAEDLDQTHFMWNTSLVEPAAECLVKVIATDGVNTGEDISDGTFTVDSRPPVITVVSPQVKTYYSDSIPVSLRVNEDLSLSSIWYSLDSQFNATIEETGFIDVLDGAHQIVFYVNDTAGNVGSSSIISFEVNSSGYYPWQTNFIGSGGYPITDLTEYDGQLYVARDNALYGYDGSGWTAVEAPTHSLTLEYYDGMLYVGGKGGLYAFDGSDFYLIFGAQNYVKTLGVHDNTLYAGTFLDNPPTLYYCNGSADNPDNWHIDTDFSALQNFSGPFGSIDSFAVYNDIMYLGSGGTLYSFDGTSWSIVKTFDDVYAFSSMKVYDGKLYLATRDQGWRKPAYEGYSGFNGRVFEFDGSSWTEVFEHDYWIFSLEVYDGKLYAGTANKIYTFNGTEWTISFDARQEGFYAIAMNVYNDKIYVGIGNGHIFADPEPIEADSKMASIPEFSSATILAVLMILTLLAVALTKKNRIRKFG